MIRAYVPSTLPTVLRWYHDGAVPPETVVHAVTAGLREGNPHADEEELEFLATKAAEEVSTVAAMTSGHRRATLAVDLTPGDAAPASAGPTSMTLVRAVALADWAALFVDDLQWYAVEEIPHLA